MRDRAAEWGFGLRALRIDMNPLPVVGGVSEQIDPLLIDFEPVADSDFLTDKTEEIGGFTDECALQMRCLQSGKVGSNG